MKNIVLKNNKILFYFILGIGLPCLLLGYFAFRGIQNDLALVEKQTWDQYRGMAKQVTAEFSDSVSVIEKFCFQSFQQLQNASEPSVKSTLQSIKNQIPLITEIFLLDSSNIINFVSTQHLFTSDEANQGFQTPSSVQHNPHFLAGQKYEFQQKDFFNAKKEYKLAFAKSHDQQVKGIYLNVIARVQIKMSDWDNAVISYQKLIRDFADVKSENNIPLGLAAGIELGKTYLLNQDTLKAIQTHIHTYNKLIQGDWLLEKSQFQFFSNTVRTMLQDIFSSGAMKPGFVEYNEDFKFKIREEFRLRRLAEFLVQFQEEAGNILVSKKIITHLDSAEKTRAILDIHGDEYFLSLFNVRRKANDRQKMGIIWNADSLKSALVLNFLSHRFQAGEHCWQLVDRDGQIISESENCPTNKLMITQSFNNNFPPWFLKLYQKNPFLFEYIFTSRRSIYLYIFVLIAGILIFGLVLTSVSVTRELELARLKSDFVSTISHEFRSPLTSIRQLAEMLQTNRVVAESRRQKYYDVIVEQSNRLTLLINNILDFSKMEEGKKQFDFERVALNNFINDFISTIQTRVDHEGFELEVDMGESPTLLRMDRSAITQALSNLVDNAIKYSGEARKIRIFTDTENLYAQIGVQDFGIGIDETEINKVFDRFYRGGNLLSRNSIKGSGLGLTLVRQIVDAHHGRISLKSEIGKGSCFTIELPIL